MAPALDPAHPPAFPAVGATDRGRLRQRNEDAYLVDRRLGLLVVADGMGGHPAGDVASALAVEEVAHHLSRADAATPGSADPEASPRLGEIMLEAVRRADARIREAAAANPSQQGMGTTLIALTARPGEDVVRITHVGDSRAYVLEDGRIHQLTRDHTWVEQQLAAGLLTPGQLRQHPLAHVLTQAAGMGEGIEPDLVEYAANTGQVYLLCTDGLTNMLTELALERTLTNALPDGLEAAAWALVDAANDRGGIDNITVALLRID